MHKKKNPRTSIMWRLVLISGISKNKQNTSAAKCILFPQICMYNLALITVKCWRINFGHPAAVLQLFERPTQSSRSFLWNWVPQFASCISSAQRALPSMLKGKQTWPTLPSHKSSCWKSCTSTNYFFSEVILTPQNTSLAGSRVFFAEWNNFLSIANSKLRAAGLKQLMESKQIVFRTTSEGWGTPK